MSNRAASPKKWVKRAETAIKVVLSLGMLCMATMVGALVIGSFLDEVYVDLVIKIIYGGLFGLFACGIVFLIIVFVFPAAMEQRFKNANILTFSVDLPENKENAIAVVEKLIIAEGYSDSERLFFHGNSYLDVFIREDALNLDCTAILRAEVFSSKVQDMADKAFGEFLNQNLRLYKVIRLTAIACTDEVNRPLRAFVRDNNDQKPEAFKFSAAIVLNTNEVLIADIKKTFAYMQYKKLRAQFMQFIQPIRLED